MICTSFLFPNLSICRSLENNQLSGSLPTSFSLLVNLQNVYLQAFIYLLNATRDLHNNYLIGTITSALETLLGGIDSWYCKSIWFLILQVTSVTTASKTRQRHAIVIQLAVLLFVAICNLGSSVSLMKCFMRKILWMVVMGVILTLT